MVLRSFVRDVITIYICYSILRGYVPEEGVTLAAVILLLITAWFLLEKIGILPSWKS